tara:strand:- start:759 stop:1106 length:348 start_codon:yes stop_codon:yes gene_type:complete
METPILPMRSNIPPSCGNGSVYPLISQRKITVHDVTIVPQGCWNTYTIPFGIELHKAYDIQVLIHDKDVYMKPKTPYCSAEFEKLFNFGIQCVNYNPQKVVKVRTPDDYYKEFKV